MVLQPCSECGQAVSTRATSCPNCGAPNTPAGRPVASRRSDENRTLSLGVLLLLAALVLAALLALGSGTADAPAVDAPAVDAPDNPVAAQAGQAACYEIEKLINALATFTTTTCIPAKGRAGDVSFLLLSDSSVFGVEKAEKAWLLVAVGAVGSVLNNQASLRADEVLLSDMAHTRRRIGYVIPASSCRRLQEQASSDHIDLSTMYASIRRQLVQREVSR